MYGYTYGYPSGGGAGAVNGYESAVLGDGGTIVAIGNTSDLYSRLLGLGLVNSASLVNSCNGGKADALYNFIPSPVQSLDRFTVTRASTKLRIGSNGLYGSVANNVPAFEFNTDGTYRGLLVEPGATNLIVRSNTFSDAAWTKTATLASDTTISPSGVQDASTFTDSSGSFLDVRTGLITITGNARYVASVYVKKTTGSLTHYAGIAVLLSSVATRVDYGIINTTTGVVNRDASSTVSSATYSSANFGEYWRVSVTFQDDQLNTSARIILYPALSSNGTSISDAAQGANVFWQAQLELGSVATSPIVTTAGTAIRVADVVSLTGASSLIGQQEGTIFAEVQINSFANAGVFFSVSDATTSNRVQLYKFTDGKIYGDRISATQSALTSISTSALSVGTYRIAFAYKSGDSALFINGVQVGSTAGQTFTFGAMGKVNIGSRFDDTQIFNDGIRFVGTSTTRIPNSTLAPLTA
jgi:hypothetical protein